MGVASLLIILLPILWPWPCASQLLHSATGDVGGGNYTYYSLMYQGAITLELVSISGDADLYVSQEISKPTYETDSYCLQSATCGLDLIAIPKSFKRPVGIGVYGHPSHDTSTYILQVFHADEIPDSDEFTNVFISPHTTEYVNQETQSAKSQAEDTEEESFFWIIISIVDLLLEVLFL